MFFFPVKLFDTNINRLWLISFIFDSSLLLEGKAKSYKEEMLIKQQIKALWTLVVFFFFFPLVQLFDIPFLSPTYTRQTSFIGISITTLFFLKNKSIFLLFLPSVWTRQVEWGDDVMEHKVRDLHSLGQEQFPSPQWEILISRGRGIFALGSPLDKGVAHPLLSWVHLIKTESRVLMLR